MVIKDVNWVIMYQHKYLETIFINNEHKRLIHVIKPTRCTNFSNLFLE